MELRNSRRGNEYKELQITLNGMGFYEEGMELQEMRQILDALQMSVNEEETNFFDCDMQQALRESELDFMPSQDRRVHNSTMMSNPLFSPCSSPEIPFESIVVEAEVHHAMDWSPFKERLPRKRFASSNMAVDNEQIPQELEVSNELLEPDAKRFQNTNISISTIKTQDLDTNIIEESSSSNNVNILEVSSNLEVSNNSSHDIHGPVSVRRIQDSGLNMSYETPHSSLNNTSKNVTNASSSDFNNFECSGLELANSINEIRGPVSMRPIHDSGISISSELHQNSNINFSNENSNSFSESSLQISNSGAVNQYDFNDESEPSI